MKKNKKIGHGNVKRGAGVVLLAGRNHTLPDKRKSKSKKACRGNF